ncbi:transmembrane protein 106B-like [Lytechinus variegatus]|uniref:transmembrane protein 106B-like n=1 Tax=Lytechinus variegatus TaxID=7654 RepID=UPI001BB114D3|nr:transmembrane protein 106B-like [Lytechinus variegatus]
MSSRLVIQNMDSDPPPSYNQYTNYGSTGNSDPEPAGSPAVSSVKEPEAKRSDNSGETMNGSGPGHYTYEELSDGFACPTCQGTGKIPRDRADDLVALIPYSDARLKPRRTLRYVLLSIFLCASLAGILIAFLLPRPISFEQKGKVATVYTSYNQTVPTMTLVLETKFDIYNKNFVAIDGQSLTITGSWSEQVIGTNITVLDSSVHVPGRQNFELSGNVTVTFTESAWVSHCVEGTITHLIYMEFIATFQYGLMSQSQQSTLTYYKAVSCRPITELDSSWPLPSELK